jgi:hypothetical protein
MDKMRSHRSRPDSENRRVVPIRAFRPPPGPPRQPDPEGARIFAGKIDIGAQIAAALAAEAKCLRFAAPADLAARLELLEAEFELIAHDMREAGEVA